jgi:hypothetical protein
MFVTLRRSYSILCLGLCLPLRLFAIDADTLIAELVSHEKLPRQLNSEDIQFKSDTPLPFRTLESDLNHDGITDLAVSGTYNLPGEGNPYFLLVGSERTPNQKPKILLFREYSKPVFIHPRGSTGEADPNDQSFSISFCMECDQGFDFYWDKKQKAFHQKTWVAKTNRVTKIVEEKAIDVPPEKVDEALKIVGPLKEVQDLVAEINKRQNKLITRVEALKDAPQMDRVLVKILEGITGTERVRGEITVDLTNKKVAGKLKKRR